MRRIKDRIANASSDDEAEEGEARQMAVKAILTLMTADFEAKSIKLAADVPTTLGRIDIDAAVALIWHGYVSAMVAMHVVYGAPLLDVPTSQDVSSRFGLLG